MGRGDANMCVDAALIFSLLQYYILRQKERDASQGGLEREYNIIRDQAQRELQDVKTSYDQQMTVLRKQRSEAMSAAQQADNENQR